MKYHRQSERRRLANRARKSMIKTFTKKAIAAAEEGDLDKAATYQKVVQGLVDRAAQSATLHKNTAARKKARLARRLRLIRELQVQA